MLNSNQPFVGLVLQWTMINKLQCKVTLLLRQSCIYSSCGHSILYCCAVFIFFLSASDHRHALVWQQESLSYDFTHMQDFQMLYWQASSFIMAALWNRAGHYIFAVVSFYLSFFFPRLISAVTDWMSTILPHMVWL